MRCALRYLTLLIAAGLALAGSLAACGGSSDGEVPPAATEAPPQTGVVVDSPAADPPSPLAETKPTPVATPEPSAEPVEPTAPDPPTPPTRVAPEPATGPTELPAEVSTSPAETTSAESVTSPPTPAPHPGVALIEPAPGAFEQRTFATGERIDWTHGIFVLNPETGRTDGYTVSEAQYGRYWSVPGGWIGVRDLGHPPHSMVLHRETGQSWRWPSRNLRLVTASSDYLLFKEIRSHNVTGHFTIASRAMEELGRFSITTKGLAYPAFFSPDGRAIAFSTGDTAYLVPVESAQPTVLFKTEATDGQVSAEVSVRPWYEGPGILVRARYENGSGAVRWDRHYFSWQGTVSRDPTSSTCQGWFSPDGRYVAWLVGGEVMAAHSGVVTREDPWASLVIADSDTCDPLFRVRSVRKSHFPSRNDWLASSDGYAIGVRDGGAIVRVHPTPSLVPLPLADGDPAPTGDGRYFGYHTRVYDVREDRWIEPPVPVHGPILAWWSKDDPPERWFTIATPDGSWSTWLLLPPKIEFPPFSDEIAFRVAGTGSCLRLRAAPGQASKITDCLPDGARLVLTEPSEPPHDIWGIDGHSRLQPHPAVAWTKPPDHAKSTWIHVRTEDGAEGWISHDYLEHD